MSTPRHAADAADPTDGDRREPTTIAARRLANDSILEAAKRFAVPGEQHLYQFVCECGQVQCRELVLLSLDQYQAQEPGSINAHV